MSSILKVDEIQDTSGNNIINENANTVTIGKSGDTVNVVGTLQNGGTNFLQGITMADQWRLTADVTTTDSVLTTNLERVDTAGQGTLGTGMTESSGVFTFPSTGIYYVTFNASFKLNGDDRVFSAIIQATTDNSTYANASEASSFIQQTGSNTTYQHIFTDALFDITDTANQKVQFRINGSASLETMANTTRDLTAMRFIRLGDT
jgi:hypothetical protein